MLGNFEGRCRVTGGSGHVRMCAEGIKWHFTHSECVLAGSSNPQMCAGGIQLASILTAHIFIGHIQRIEWGGA